MKRIVTSCFLLILLAGGVVFALDRWSASFISLVRYGYFSLPSFMERRTVMIDDRTVSFLLARFARGEKEWNMATSPSTPKSIHEWRTHLGADFVVNGSYFSATGEPTGFYQTPTFESVVAWPDFSNEVKPIGYTFAVWIDDGDLDIGYIPNMTTPPAPNIAAFASFPTLILNDQPMVEKDSGALARRTMLAKDSKESMYVIVTESGELS
ncbi:MAG: hypothetical protein AAB839_01040, partial [Patescibacteria group bacterium]